MINALKSPHTTTNEVGAIIAKDMAMMTKLLQVTNSACFGLPRKISDPVEAVGILGFETVKSMVMTLKLLSQYDKVKPVYFSIDRLWRHSTEVARISRRIAFCKRRSRPGRIRLHRRFDARSGQARSVCGAEPRPGETSGSVAKRLTRSIARPSHERRSGGSMRSRMPREPLSTNRMAVVSGCRPVRRYRTLLNISC